MSFLLNPFRFGGGGPPPVGAHRYWSVRFDTAISPDTNVVLNGLYWYENPYGDKITGSVTASNTAASHKSASLLDDESFVIVGTTSTSMWGSSSLPVSVVLDLGAGNEKEIGGVEMFVATNGLSGGAKNPATWTVQYSDDGSTWTDAWSDSESNWYSTPNFFRLGRMSFNPSYSGVSDGIIPLLGSADWAFDPADSFSDAGSTPAVNNDPVQQVTNLGISGSPFVQPTSARRPIFKTGGTNGLPYLEFTAANEHFFSDIALAQGAGLTSVTPYMVAIIAEDTDAASASRGIMGNPATLGGKFGVYLRSPSGAMIHAAKNDFRVGDVVDTPAEILVIGILGANNLHIGQNDGFIFSNATGTYNNTALTVAELFRNTGIAGGAYFEGKVYAFGIWHNTSLNVPAINRIRRSFLRKMGRI